MALDTKGSSSTEKIRDLNRRLIEAEDIISALINGQVDAVIDPENKQRVLLTNAQSAMLESEERYHRLVRRMSALVFEIEPNGTLHFVNEALTKITGYVPEELSGRTWLDKLFPGELGERVLQLLEKAHHEDTNNVEIDLVTKDGRRLTFEINSANRYSSDGELELIVGFGIDVTKRKEAERELHHRLTELEQAEEGLRIQNELLVSTQWQVIEERQRYQELFEFAPDGYLVTDPSGKILESNRAAAEMLHIRQDLLAGKQLVVFLPDDERASFHELLNRLRNSRQTQGLESMVRCQDGSFLPVAIIVAPVITDNGALSALRWQLHDISDRKLGESQLRQKSAAVQLLQEVAAAANEALDVRQALEFALSRVCAFTGWPVGHVYFHYPDQPVPLITSDIWHLSDVSKYELFRVATERLNFLPGDTLPGKVVLDNLPKWLDIRQEKSFVRQKEAIQANLRMAYAFPVLVGGKVAAVLEFFSSLDTRLSDSVLDVMANIGTQIGRVLERQQAEDALKNSTKLFEGMFESAPDATILVDSSGQIVRANDQTLSLFGYHQDELTGQLVEILMPPRFRGTHVNYREVFSSKPLLRQMGHGLELFGQHKDGYEFPIDVMLSPLETPNGLMIICGIRDITERLRVESELRERDSLIQSAGAILPIVLFVIDLDGQVRLSIGKSMAADRIGKSSSVGYSVYEIFSDVPGLVDNFERAQSGNTFNTTVEIDQRHYNFYYAPLRDVKGVIDGVVGVAVDLTEELKAEEALRESEDRFKTIFENAANGILLISLDGEILASNPALTRLLRYSADEIQGTRFIKLIHEEDIAEINEIYAALTNNELDQAFPEVRFLDKNGIIYWTKLTLSLNDPKSGAKGFVVGMVENISQQKQMREELGEVQRRLMDSSETERLRLAQELHDGPVQDLYGVTYQLRAVWNELGTEGQARMTAAQATLHQVIHLLRALTGELRPPTLAPFGLEKAIRSHAEFFQKAHTGLTMNLELMPDRKVLPERVRLTLFRIYQQALINVIRHSEANQVTIRLKMDSQSLLLEIQDNGKGFDVPQRWIHLARRGQLGLIGAVERAEAIGGLLKVESKPEMGTKVSVTVPLAGILRNNENKIGE